MADISVVWNNDTGRADWQLRHGDVAISDSDLLSSVMLLLFTDRTSSDDFTPADGDRRGWWGNEFEPYEIGSRLWQLDRGKFAANHNILLMARDYTREALQPLLDQGIAARLLVDVQKQGSNGLIISIDLYKPKVPLPVTFRFAWAWNQIKIVPARPAVVGDRAPLVAIYDISSYGDGSSYG